MVGHPTTGNSARTGMNLLLKTLSWSRKSQIAWMTREQKWKWGASVVPCDLRLITLRGEWRQWDWKSVRYCSISKSLPINWTCMLNVILITVYTYQNSKEFQPVEAHMMWTTRETSESSSMSQCELLYNCLGKISVRNKMSFSSIMKWI